MTGQDKLAALDMLGSMVGYPDKSQAVVKDSVTNELKARVLKIYTPPFRHSMGYICDAKNLVVADDKGVACCVKGLSSINYRKDIEALQDQVGEIIAEALTAYWALNKVQAL